MAAALSLREIEHRRHGSATESSVGAVIGASGYAIMEKMRWRTPPEVVGSIAADLKLPDGRFDLDAAAEDAYHLADAWFTEEDDCLQQDWRRGFRVRLSDGSTGRDDGRREIRSVWFNPPYGRVGVSAKMREAFPTVELAPFPGTVAFVEHAWSQSMLGLTVAVLLGSAMDQWAARLASRADEVWYGPRIHFRHPETGKAQSPTSAHMLLVFRPHVPVGGWPGGPRIRWDWRPLGESGEEDRCT